MAVKNRFKFKLLYFIAKVTRKFHPPGTERILRLIYHPDKRANDYFQTIIDYDGNLRINIDSSSFIEWLIFFYGFYEKEAAGIIKKIAKPDFVCFDVGANIGVHTLIMAKNCGKVFAFEPNPAIFKKLLDNLTLNKFNNIISVQSAVSDFSGQSTLYFDKNSSNQGMATLNKPVENNLDGAMVNVTAIDEFVRKHGVKRLDLLKSDTEGSDYKVLLGAKDSIFRFRPYLLFEYEMESWRKAGFNLENLKELLKPLNYEFFEIKKGGPKPLGENILYANIFAIPR